MLQAVHSFTKRAQGFVMRRYHRLKDHLADARLRKLIVFINGQYPELKVSLLDVGARKGLEGRYDELTKLKGFYAEGIEPDKAEAKALLALGHYRKVHPVAVADETGRKRLYVTKVLGCTSIHKPNTRNLERFAISPWFETQSELEISVTTLGALYPGDDRFDFISMDVQGAEYEVIKGGEKLLDQALGVSLEVHFFEVYEGQKLFPSMHELCLKKGFRLINMSLNNFDGEIAEAECAYVKNHQLLKTKEDVLKCILFSLNWQNRAYVENLLRNASDKLLSPLEKKQILEVLKLKGKQKLSLWPDGLAAKVHGDGSGYK
jgi:FkbM family methyltransferase